MENYIKIFNALGDETRVNILKIISKQNICAKGIASRLKLSESAVSQAIKILKEVNLIIGYKRGYHVMYQLNKDKFNEAISFINSITGEKEVVSFKCSNNCKNRKCYCHMAFKEDLKMKVCFPVNNNLGMESVPYGHFGTAPMFVVCDTESGEVRTINNGDMNHEHGHCSPIKALMGEKVDVVVVGGIGKGAINGLNANGVKVCKAIEGTIKDNLDAYKNGKLQEFSPNNTCNHDGCTH